MPILKISQHEVDVDITAELDRYDWTRPRWSSDKLIAGSPFRPDSTPSFFVRLDGEYAGAWADSGAIDDEYTSGGFVKLLAFLRGEYYEDTVDYLLDTYGALYVNKPGEEIRLPSISLREPVRYIAPDGSTLTQAVSPYLTLRNISEAAQRRYSVGYGANYAGFTAMPWYTPDGRLANVKYRSTRGKTFFYERGATPIHRLVYGLDVVNAERADTAVLCEGEIDVLSWATVDVHAIAVGGSSISNAQMDAVKRSSIRKLALGADNDAAGKRLNAEVERKLGGHVALYAVNYGEHNDANDVLKTEGPEALRQLSNFTKSELRENCLQLRKYTVK